MSESFRCRILVADDEPGVVEAFLEVLAPRDTPLSAVEELRRFAGEAREPAADRFACRVTAVEQGELAVERVRAAKAEGDPYSVVFLDVRMPPGIDGVETARRIRELDDFVYIIIVSAYSDRGVDEMQAAARHDVTFVRKPLDDDEILQLARNACNSWRGDEALRRRLQEMERRLAESADAPPPPGEARLTCSTGGLITSVTAEASTLLGEEVDELLFGSLADRLPGVDWPALVARVAGGEVFEVRHQEVVVADGNRRRLTLSIRSAPVGEGADGEVRVSLRDDDDGARP